MVIKAAETLTAARKAHNATQGEIAEKLGVSRQAVSKWEHGESLPDLEKLFALADVYGISLDELLGHEVKAKKAKKAPAAPKAEAKPAPAAKAEPAPAPAPEEKPAPAPVAKAEPAPAPKVEAKPAPAPIPDDDDDDDDDGAPKKKRWSLFGRRH